jgi:hypothetical protein
MCCALAAWSGVEGIELEAEAPSRAEQNRQIDHGSAYVPAGMF